jgi:hypothetical protein
VAVGLVVLLALLFEAWVRLHDCGVNSDNTTAFGAGICMVWTRLLSILLVTYLTLFCGFIAFRFAYFGHCEGADHENKCCCLGLLNYTGQCWLAQPEYISFEISCTVFSRLQY